MIKTTIEFTDSTIRELLICALEGGSNYWCLLKSLTYAENVGPEDFEEEGELWADGWELPYALPFVAGCALVIGDAEDPDDHTKNKHLDRGLIEGGLQLMAEKRPKVFADILADKIDADTGDIFLQYCLFGEVIYG